MKTNVFDNAQWLVMEKKWRDLVYWAASAAQSPLWAIVPDQPGNREATLEKYERYVLEVVRAEIRPAIAVQDGMMPSDVHALSVSPYAVCVGGTTDWKWETAEMWIKEFENTHILRCNSPAKLYWLEKLGCKSCDGTGWNRGDRKQTLGLEKWARQHPEPRISPLTPYTCRKSRNGQLQWAF